MSRKQVPVVDISKALKKAILYPNPRAYLFRAPLCLGDSIFSKKGECVVYFQVKPLSSARSEIEVAINTKGGIEQALEFSFDENLGHEFLPEIHLKCEMIATADFWFGSEILTNIQGAIIATLGVFSVEETFLDIFGPTRLDLILDIPTLGIKFCKNLNEVPGADEFFETALERDVEEEIRESLRDTKPKPRRERAASPRLSKKRRSKK